MFSRHLMRRAFPVGAFGAALVLSAASGSAEPERAKDAKDAKESKHACTISYKSAQEREHAGHLREAKELWHSCIKPSCSAFIRQECGTKFTQLENDVPSIVPVVTDDSGTTRLDVQVRMDGELIASQLDGRAIAAEPGTHEFTFSTDKGVFASEKIVLMQGQRNRPVPLTLHTGEKRAQNGTLAASVTLPPPASDRSALEPRAESGKSTGDKPSPHKLVSEKPALDIASEEAPPAHLRRAGPGVLPFVLGGVGLAGVGAGALLTAWGKKDNQALGQCAPDCSKATLNHIRTLYTVADISLGAGAVAIGIATYLFADRGFTKEKPPARSAYVFDVQPTPSGAFASVSGAF
jgi:hypothetical protein